MKMKKKNQLQTCKKNIMDNCFCTCFSNIYNYLYANVFAHSQICIYLIGRINGWIFFRDIYSESLSGFKYL